MKTPSRKYFLGLRGQKLQTAQLWTVILPAYILFGYNNGVAGPLLNLEPWIETFPRLDTLTTTGAAKSDNARIQGTVVALYTLGCFFGSLSTILFSDRLGRIRTIQAGAAGCVVGAIISSSAFSLAQLIVGRLVLGVGFGILSATAPNWQSECASAQHRGAAVLYESVFISFGLVIGGWAELGLSFAANSSVPSISWRFSLALPALFALLVLILTPLFPESPRWLVKHGRREEAVAALCALDGGKDNDGDGDTDSSDLQAALSEIEESLAITGSVRPFSIFRNNTPQRLLHRTWLAAMGQMFQQVCGINALAFFLSTVFQQYLGFSAVSARVISAAVFTWQLVCSPIGVLTVDRFGRRPLMLVSSAGMGICMAVVAGVASQTVGRADPSRAAAAVAGAFIFLFGAFFPVGFLSLTFLYAAEVAPLAARVPVTAFGSATAWIFNFVVAEITPIGLDNIGWRYYLIYAVINLFLILPCVYFFFPETAGRELEDVDSIFRNSGNIFDAVRVARTMDKGAIAVVRGDGGGVGKVEEGGEMRRRVSEKTGDAVGGHGEGRGGSTTVASEKGSQVTRVDQVDSADKQLEGMGKKTEQG